jgi:holo-[acyl-carrier protein] synthase
MIYGVGTDLVEIARVRQMLERYGERFARRLLGPSEWGDFQRAGNKAQHLAGRFAAKEAFAKALGTGLRYPVSLSNINVANDALGKPVLLFEPKLAALVQSHGVTSYHLSVSHERSVACAFVVLEGHTQPGPRQP